MTAKARWTLFGLFAGVVVGAIPFSLIGAEGGHVGYVALAVAVGAGAASYRAPGWWCAGVGLGIMSGWLFWVVAIAADWKLLFYALLVYQRIYFVAALALLLPRLLAHHRVVGGV